MSYNYHVYYILGLSEYFPQCMYTLENIISELDNYFGILPNIDYVGKS